ncbi:MAG: hypothetical protein LBB85_05340 [Dysgonamonadaceae bacterium]|nr:hypothetical protein [Dysgonamonadaceae bacterium]
MKISRYHVSTHLQHKIHSAKAAQSLRRKALLCRLFVSLYSAPMKDFTRIQTESSIFF